MLAVLVAGVLVGLVSSPEAVHAATIAVTTTDDDAVANGNCTLREAIEAANTNLAVDACPAGAAAPTVDRIELAIAPAGGVKTILLGSLLPAITERVTIDGFTQSGASPNTRPLGEADDAVITVEIDATGLNAGLVIQSGGVTIRGLSVGGANVSIGFLLGAGIRVTGGTDATIAGNRLGLRADGATARPSVSGVIVEAGASATVGGTAPADRNIISGNTVCNVRLQDFAAGGTVLNNYLGTNAAGTSAFATSQANVQVGASPAQIGQPGAGNLISGSGFAGVYLVHADNLAVVQANRIGTNAAGTAALPNDHGIFAFSGRDTLIGTDADGTDDAAEGNLISGNTTAGIWIRPSNAPFDQAVTIAGNAIGTNLAGTGAVPNGVGIQWGDGANDLADSTIGGVAPAARNVISGNTGAGIRVTSVFVPTGRLEIFGNLIGLDAAGTGPLPNGGAGIDILANTSMPTTIGGTAAGRANSIDQNGGLGIDIDGDGVTANDANDADGGPNGRQNFPVLTQALSFGGTTRISGALNSTANTTFNLDVFANTAVDDAISEGPHSAPIALAATSADPASNGIAVPGVTADIADNEGGSALSIADATATEGNSGTATLTFAVTLTPPNANQVTVQYATGGGTATSGAACNAAGVDYAATSGTLTFPAASAAPQQVAVTVCGDSLAEGNETLTVTLSNATGDATIADGSATGTITDDDGVAGLAVGDAVADEGTGGTRTLTITVTLAPASGAAVTVQYATGGGSAVGGATCAAGIDYVEASGTLAVASGETSAAVPVTLCSDALAEGNETFELTLSNATGGVAIADGTGVGTIRDGDAGGTLAFSAATASASEAGGSVALTVVRTGGLADAVTVRVATANGTATAGIDYTAVATTVTFAAGETSKAVVVPVLADDIDEPDETFTATLSSPTGGAVLGAPTTVAVTIQEVDRTPCQTTLAAAVPAGSTVLPVVSQAGCQVGDHIAIDRGGPTEERSIVAGFGSIVLDQPTQRAHAAGQVVVRIDVMEDLGRAVVPPKDDTDKPRQETETERRQRERTNQLGLDDQRVEGNVVELRCDDGPPAIVVANRDGRVVVRLLGPAAERCSDVRMGDYLEATGEKLHELLYEATDLSIERRHR